MEAISKFLKGDKYFCNICNKGFSRFLSTKFNKNELCPNCLSHSRHRLLMLHLLYYYPLFRSGRILHFAPEKCLQEFFQNFKNYSTIDAAPGCDYQGNMLNLPFEDNSFDFIIANHVLEHIPDDKKAIHELYRIFTDGGIGIVSVPFGTFREDLSVTAPEERERLFGQKDHVRIYDKSTFTERLENAGFKVRLVCAGMFPATVKEKFLLADCIAIIEK